jgi:hypothetical protein
MAPKGTNRRTLLLSAKQGSKNHTIHMHQLQKVIQNPFKQKSLSALQMKQAK